MSTGETAEQRLVDALDVLREIEFSGHGMNKCPLCVGWNVGPQRGETPYQHRKDCRLAKLLREAGR